MTALEEQIHARLREYNETLANFKIETKDAEVYRMIIIELIGELTSLLIYSNK